MHLSRDRKNGFDYNYRSEVLPATLPAPEKKRKTKFCLPETATASSSSSSPLRGSNTGDVDRGRTMTAEGVPVSEWGEGDLRGTSRGTLRPNTTTYKLHRNKATHDRFLSGHLPRTTEAPSHPYLLEKDEWISTSGNINHKDVAAVLDTKTKKSLRNSRIWTADISQKHPIRTTRKYRSPVQQQSDLNNKVRSLKTAGSFWQSLKPMRDDPTAEVNKISKHTFENRFAQEPARYLQNQYHSGVWELNKREGKYMWSDTGSFIYHDAGDIISLTKLDRPNHEGPTLPMENFYCSSKRINLIE